MRTTLLAAFMISSCLCYAQEPPVLIQAEKITGSILQHAVTEKELLIDRNRNYFTELTASAHDSVHISEPELRRSSSLLQSLEGIYSDYLRSDNNIAVGPEHVVQVINSSYLSSLIRVWDKAGNILIDKSLFKDLTGDFDWGDPNIIYDWEADRFVITFLFSEEDQKLIIAVSDSNDPTGSWTGYSFITPGKWPDYEKLGRWGNSYVITTATSHPAVYLVNRDQLLSGEETLDVVSLSVLRIPGMSWQGLSPIHQTGYNPLPDARPPSVARIVEGSYYPEDSVADRLEIFSFQINWADPLAATVTGPVIIPVMSFDHSVCDSVTPNACLEQPGTDVRIWPCEDFLMDKPQMVIMDGNLHVVCTHVVNAGDSVAGMKWYELLCDASGSWSLVQEGLQSPDENHRFMGSISINEDGVIALGYNIVSSTVFPGFRAATHRPCDPQGTMGEEITGATGSAPNASNSYGDYNSMVSDPTDGSFWFTAQYNASSKWSTRVIQFSADSCTTDQIETSANTIVQWYPNPANNLLHVSCKEPGTWYIRITDQSGKDIYISSFYDQTNVVLDSFPAGLYIGNVYNDAGRETQFTFVRN